MAEDKVKGQKYTGVLLGFLAVGMLAMAYASVPIYRIFCQKTGYGGTTQVAAAPSSQVCNRVIHVRFNADVHRDLPWYFKPLQTQISVKVGENALAFYESRNNSKEPVLGMATYNVTPDKAGIYFQKIACFCFEEQILQPGQHVTMPVQFFIDPEIMRDPSLDDVKTITLSYTFFRLKK